MQGSGSTVAVVGTGFVADLYMRSLQAFPDIRVGGAYDRDPARLQAFCRHWKVPAAASLDELLAEGAGQGAVPLVLNLTNPGSHYAVTKQLPGKRAQRLFREAPGDAHGARERAARSRPRAGPFLASAPCNHLSQSAQTLHWAVRERLVGRPLLVYAELDDDFITAGALSQVGRASRARPGPTATSSRSAARSSTPATT